MTEEKDKVDSALRSCVSNLAAFYDSLYYTIRVCMTHGEVGIAHRLIDRTHDIVHIMEAIQEGLYELKEAEGRNE